MGASKKWVSIPKSNTWSSWWWWWSSSSSPSSPSLWHASHWNNSNFGLHLCYTPKWSQMFDCISSSSLILPPQLPWSIEHLPQLGWKPHVAPSKKIEQLETWKYEVQTFESHLEHPGNTVLPFLGLLLCEDPHLQAAFVYTYATAERISDQPSRSSFWLRSAGSVANQLSFGTL